jgi:hypothetical protein
MADEIVIVTLQVTVLLRKQQDHPRRPCDRIREPLINDFEANLYVTIYMILLFSHPLSLFPSYIEHVPSFREQDATAGFTNDL